MSQADMEFKELKFKAMVQLICANYPKGDFLLFDKEKKMGAIMLAKDLVGAIANSAYDMNQEEYK